jgi:diguanylate cyclase (GGDEF)-like protein
LKRNYLILRSYLWLPLLGWTLVVAASLVWNLVLHHQAVLEMARHSARINYQKDVSYRRWNAEQGGVYVFVGPGRQPNPQLALFPDRDLTVGDGRKLTLVTPAHMTRQVYAMAQRESEVRGNIICSRALDPARQPDSWEAEALKRIEQGSREVSATTMLDHKPYLRLMRPIHLEQACFSCHQGQGYKVGEVRGGISISIPLEPLWAASRSHLLALWGGHLAMWLLGLGGIVLGYLRLRENLHFRQEAEGAMIEANEKLKVMVFEAGLRHRQTTLLNDMTEMLQTCTTIGEAHQALNYFLPQLFPEEAGALFVFQDSRDFLEPVVVWGMQPPDEQPFEPGACLAVRRGRSHYGAGPQGGMNCGHVAAAAGAHLCVPLMAQGEIFGVLLLQQDDPESSLELPPGEQSGLSDTTRQLAGVTAEHLSLALSNLRLRETLARQAMRDSLTGLFNRRYLEESLERELHRVSRKQLGLGVIMADLDHFKRFNDTFGHKAGDALLAAMGQVLRGCVRQGDIPCRYGGEEFVLILPEITLEHLKARAAAVQRRVQEVQVFHEGKYLGQVTLSLGLALFPEHGTSAEALMAAADTALYRAKAAGRNCLVAAGDPLPPAEA